MGSLKPPTNAGTHRTRQHKPLAASASWAPRLLRGGAVPPGHNLPAAPRDGAREAHMPPQIRGNNTQVWGQNGLFPSSKGWSQKGKHKRRNRIKFKRKKQLRAGIAIQLRHELFGRRRGEHLAPVKIKLNFHTCSFSLTKRNASWWLTDRQGRLLQRTF